MGTLTGWNLPKCENRKEFLVDFIGFFVDCAKCDIPSINTYNITLHSMFFLMNKEKKRLQ